MMCISGFVILLLFQDGWLAKIYDCSGCFNSIRKLVCTVGPIRIGERE